MSLFEEPQLVIGILNQLSARDVLMSCKSHYRFIKNRELWQHIAKSELDLEVPEFNTARLANVIKVYKKYGQHKCMYMFQKGPRRSRQCGKPTIVGSGFCGRCQAKRNKRLLGVYLERGKYITMDSGIVFKYVHGFCKVKGIIKRNTNIKHVTIFNINDVYSGPVRSLTSSEKERISGFDRVIV